MSESVVSSAARVAGSNAVFPWLDGSFAHVETENGRVSGFVIIDRGATSRAEQSVRIAVLPADGPAGLWQGAVSAGQVTVDSTVERPDWWEAMKPFVVELMHGRREVEEAQAAQKATEVAVAELGASHERWRDALLDSVHGWVNDYDLAAQFDDFVEEHGLPKRSHVFAIEVDATVSVPLNFSVLASNREAAEKSVSEADVVSGVRALYGIAAGVAIDVTGWTVL